MVPERSKGKAEPVPDSPVDTTAAVLMRMLSLAPVATPSR
jgi:hypothetical protein